MGQGTGRVTARMSSESVASALVAVDQRLLAGDSLREAVAGIGIATSTYYRWRRRVAGGPVRGGSRERVLERENGRLRRVVADQAIAIEALREISRGTY